MNGNTILTLCVAAVLIAAVSAVWLGQSMNRRDRRESDALKAARAEREMARARAQEAHRGANGGSDG